MRTLSRSVQFKGAVGKRLAIPWAELSDLVRLHTKEVLIIAGAPGSGKSMVAVNFAIDVDYPVLYIAQDTPASVIARMVAITEGLEVSSATRMLSEGKASDELAQRLAIKTDHILIERRPLTVDGVRERIDALTEWYGEAPPLVIIDNLIDMRVDGHTHADMNFFTKTLPELKFIANERNVCIILLHHVVRGGDSRGTGRGTARLTMNDLYFAGEREARHVWGVYNNTEDRMFVQILKQQDGKADPEGGLEVELQWYPSLARLVELTA